MLKKITPYLLLLHSIIVIGLMFGWERNGYTMHIVRLAPISSTVHFIIKTTHLKDVFINIIGNLCLFAPYGFIGLWLPKYQHLPRLIIDFLSLIIVLEFLQYISRLGVFDIDDVIINTIGVYLGFQLYQFIEKKNYWWF